MAHAYSNIETVYGAKIRIGVTLLSALIRTVIELARLTDTPTPYLNTVYTLIRLLQKGLEESRPS